MQIHKIELINNYKLKNDELINFLYDPNDAINVLDRRWW